MATISMLSMKRRAWKHLVALLVIGTVWTASTDKSRPASNEFETYAQLGRLFLNNAQEQYILRAVAKYDAKTSGAPPGFSPEIGGVVPRSILLKPLPVTVSDKIWAVQSRDYVLLRDELLIVSPKGRIIEDIIAR
jgi:hypothetical protein